MPARVIRTKPHAEDTGCSTPSGLRKSLVLVLLFLAMISPRFATGQKIDFVNAHASRSMQAVHIHAEIKIDGVLDETEWQLAEPATDFIQKLPATGEPATEQTEVRLLYDDQNLYVGVYCFDSAGRDGIVVNDITKDFRTTESDGFQIVLDTYDDNRNSFLFATNPAAGRWDMQIGADGDLGNSSWDGIWYLETKITDEGWQLEMAIPFKTLRFSGQEQQVWGVNFERRVRRKFEDSYWAPLPPPYRLGRVSLAGTLEGLSDLRHGRNLYVKPYISLPILQREEDDFDFMPDVGLDVKYGLATALTLDLTVNTDFSQVEVDEQQVNLTRFSLFFPEKRDFFLENSEVFGWGRWERSRRFVPDVMPFFTRRIGLNDDGDIVPILGGARLTGRAGAYSLGLLTMQEDEFQGQPSTNYSVIRVRRDILHKSDVGGIFVNKHAAPGDYNRTYGVDGKFTFFNYLDLSSYILRTETPGVDSKDTATNFEASWIDGFFETRAKHLRIGDEFNPEVGFAPRTGMFKTSGEFGITPRPETVSWLRELHPQIEADYITNTENELETRKIEAQVSVTFNDSTFLTLSRESTFERLDEEFEVADDVMIPPGDYRFTENSIGFRSDRSRRFSLFGRYGEGGFWNGNREFYLLGFILQPSYRLSTEISWRHNDVSLADDSFTTHLISSRLNYSFSNRMFLGALIQYNSELQEISSNIRFNFMHRPLSDLYLVYNERRSTDAEIIDRAIIAKLTYLFAF